jgi:putative endonuclease
MVRLSNGSLYTGITNNLEKRLKTHADGKGSKYVRSHLPFELVYKEVVADQSAALIREDEIKSKNAKYKKGLIDSPLNSMKEKDNEEISN